MRLETERLEIQPFDTDDLDMIYQLYSNHEIMRYMPNDYMDLQAAKEHLDRIVAAWKEQPVTDREMLVRLKESGEKIGRCRIHMESGTKTAMIGWLLLEKEWNKGYATEITKALLAYCFDMLGAEAVNALCHPQNTGSCRVLEKCHMKKKADYPKKCRYVKDGVISWQDEREYRITRTEYMAGQVSSL